MPYKLVTSASAKRQLREINAWWRANRKAAPSLFSEEFEQAAKRIAVFPESGTPYVDPTRYVVLSGARYRVYYDVDDARRRIVVLAIRSGRRGTQPRF